jgi:hypothetical protein
MDGFDHLRFKNKRRHSEIKINIRKYFQVCLFRILTALWESASLIKYFLFYQPIVLNVPDSCDCKIFILIFPDQSHEQAFFTADPVKNHGTIHLYCLNLRKIFKRP